VLFDSWYPSETLLKRIRDYGWFSVCPPEKNRSFAGRAWRASLLRPYWHAVEALAGRLKGLVVSYRRKYYATNRLNLSGHEVRTVSRKRQEVEEVIRVLQISSTWRPVNQLQAAQHRAAPPTSPGARASYHSSGGVPHCGVRTAQVRPHLAPAQAISHPQRWTGLIAYPRAGEKSCVRSVPGAGSSSDHAVQGYTIYPEELKQSSVPPNRSPWNGSTHNAGGIKTSFFGKRWRCSSPQSECDRWWSSWTLALPPTRCCASLPRNAIAVYGTTQGFQGLW
jgi:hypothetical protein